MSENPTPHDAPGPKASFPGLPGVLLVVRALSLGSTEGLTVLRYGADFLREGRRLVWPKGQLTAATFAEVDAVVSNQLSRALTERFGIQGELGEALGG